MGRGRRVVFALAPCVTLPRGSDHGASPCCAAIVIVALRPVRPVLQRYLGVFALVPSVYAVMLNEEDKKGHDDACKTISVWLFFLAGECVGVVKGGNGHTPSAAPISLPFIVSFCLNVGDESCVSALRTCRDCAIQGFLTPESKSRSAFFGLSEHAIDHLRRGTERRLATLAALSVHSLCVDGSKFCRTIVPYQSHVQHDREPGPC